MQRLNAGDRACSKQVAELDAPYRKTIAEAKQARLEPEYRDALAVEATKRTPEQNKLAAARPVAGQGDVGRGRRRPDAGRPENARQRCASRLHALEARSRRPPAHAWTVTDTGAPLVAHVLQRGDLKQHGARVVSGLPAVLPRRQRPAADRRRGSTALDLARWLTRPDHPLTARVIVNRLWQHHFGRGLCGHAQRLRRCAASRRPHPELLDWLAGELVEQRLVAQAPAPADGALATPTSRTAGPADAATPASIPTIACCGG